MRAAQQILSVDENLGANSGQNEEHSERLDYKLKRTDAWPSFTETPLQIASAQSY